MSASIGSSITIIQNGYRLPYSQKDALISLAENNCDGWSLMVFLIVEIKESQLDGVPFVNVILTFLERTREDPQLRVLSCRVLSNYKRFCRSLLVVLCLASCIEDAKNENLVARVLNIIANETVQEALSEELHLLANYGTNRIDSFPST